MTTGSENIEVIQLWRRFLFAEYVERMKDTRLPKCMMFGELVGGVGGLGSVGGGIMNGGSLGRHQSVGIKAD